jgi:hypothetical protein
MNQKPVDPLLAQGLRDGQRPLASAIAGGIAAVACATGWMVVVMSTGSLLPVITVVMGAGCGYAIGYFGRSVEAKFGLMAAGFTALAWLLGLGLMAYTLETSPWVILSAKPLLEHILFLLVGTIVAYQSSFLWLSRAQKWALWDDRTSPTKRD